jgi:thiosulfate reductase cytochrome b subunit
MHHSLITRLTHWLNAIAVLLLMTSGWQIYNASPLFNFSIPSSIALGNWLGGALAWHFAAIWLLFANTCVLLGTGLLTGQLRQRLLPVTATGIMQDLKLALRLRLPHQSTYNQVQRATYLAVLATILLTIASGLALWKPVQLAPLAFILGGYETARRIHFLAMAGIAAFLILHVALVAIVPRTLLAMTIGHPPTASK